MPVLAMTALPGLRVVVRARYSPRTRGCLLLVVAFSASHKARDTRPQALTFHPLVFQQASARKGRTPHAKAKAVTSNIVSRGSELEQLKKLSHLVLETASVGASTFEELGPQAATVSPSVLLHTLHDNTTADVGALEGAMVYEPCDVDYTGSEDARLECVIDKAFVNLGGMMADRVGGLVSVEIVEDKATALSAEAIVAKARHMRAMFDEINVDASKYLFKIPGTWAGVQAVRTLEAEGVACHVTQVHSLTQAAAFGRAGATADAGLRRQDAGVVQEPPGAPVIQRLTRVGQAPGRRVRPPRQDHVHERKPRHQDHRELNQRSRERACAGGRRLHAPQRSRGAHAERRGRAR